MELDTLYYYRLEKKKNLQEGKGTFMKKGEIKMKDCLDIFEKDMKKSKEKGFSFRIHLGDKIITFMAHNDDLRKK